MSLDTDKKRLSQVNISQKMQCNMKPEHIFRQLYDELHEASQAQLGWQWLLPLCPADFHHLQSLRIFATDEQQDFDSLVLSLTKILIDSLNEKSLIKLIPFEKQEKYKNKRGIALLEAALHLNNLGGSGIHIDFLRKLQKLRSSGSAHGKGRTYLKIAEHFDTDSFRLSLNGYKLSFQHFLTMPSQCFLSWIKFIMLRQ